MVILVTAVVAILRLWDIQDPNTLIGTLAVEDGKNLLLPVCIFYFIIPLARMLYMHVINTLGYEKLLVATVYFCLVPAFTGLWTLEIPFNVSFGQLINPI